MDRHVVVLESVGITIQMPSVRIINETTIPVPPSPAFQSTSPTLAIWTRSASVELRSSNGGVFITVEIPLTGWRSSLQPRFSYPVRICLDAEASNLIPYNTRSRYKLIAIGSGCRVEGLELRNYGPERLLGGKIYEDRITDFIVMLVVRVEDHYERRGLGIVAVPIWWEQAETSMEWIKLK
jgi:hypothetical protein